ncbi:MAG: 5-bromo-4-chloroindolyl phosphate hydrolysis family protein [Oscillospiraceae bacterium]|jgi:hypothetical protein|nr:5-bromo-4-chloroindolyl phosphate hydrolysis family protein [Oscillospiraceae bacterium]
MNGNANLNNQRGGNRGGRDTSSWIGIIICLFAFWPVGLILLIRKLREYARDGQAAARQGAPVQSAPAQSVPAGRRSQKKAKKSKPKRPDGAVSALLLVLGIGLSAAWLALFIPALGEIISNGGLDGLGRRAVIDALIGAFFGVGGALSLVARGAFRKKMSKFRKYSAVIGKRDTMPLLRLSSTTGFSVRAVRRDVQAMIDGGWFEPESYIDDELNCFALNFEAAQALRAERQAPPAPVRTDNPYMKIIIELRELNETIIDIAISDKIDKIEIITAKIFRSVEDDPSKLPHIRRFMSYYLPSTLKLLRSYATLEKQGELGKNILVAKESINGVLDTLATGFEQQLDKLFQTDAIDITSDISVLEKMMRSDGLMGAGPLSQQAAQQSSLTKPQ